MDQVQPPYFIEYRVNDVDDFSAEAAFGALRESQHGHYRVLRAVVRIGDYKQDSFYARGECESTILPLDNYPIALRHQIWLATYAVQLSSSAQADDGMRLGRSPAFVVARMEELPSHDALMTDSKNMLDTIVALRQAPIVEEEYRGPVLFSADAADDIVASLIGQ